MTPRSDAADRQLSRRQVIRGGAAAVGIGVLGCRTDATPPMSPAGEGVGTGLVRGFVAPGFEPVRERFLEHAKLLGAGGAAFAAAKDGALVVDLWAGKRRFDLGPESDWQRDTRVHIQSTSKAVAAWPAMLLVELGELDLDQRVAHYWPEYGTNGKEETTLRHLLSHTAGSTRLPGYTEVLDLEGNGFDQYDEIASRLAAAEPDWIPGTAHGYHGYTYGNLVSEVVRRVTGKRSGEFVRDELVGPLGLNLWLGTPVQEQGALAQIRAWPKVQLPELPPEVVDAMPDAAAMAEQMASSPLFDPEAWQYHAGFKGLLGGPLDEFSKNVQHLWSQPRALAAEFGAANATSDARSLANLYLPLAMKGEIGATVAGCSRLSERTLADFSMQAQPGGTDLVIGMEMGWRCGSHHANRAVFPTVPSVFGPNPAAFGMTGGGGNFGFADPDAGVSAGFVRNHYTNALALSSYLVEALYDCFDGSGA